jgi:hypothetical protein
MSSLIDQHLSGINQTNESNYLLIPIDYKYDEQQIINEPIRYQKQKDMAKT